MTTLRTLVDFAGRWWLAAFAGLVLVFLLTPVFIVVPMSFSGANYLEFPPRIWSTRWYEAYFSSREWMAATRTSLSVALCTVIIATPAGFLAAYAIRHSKARPAALLYGVLLLPQVVPVILLAIGVFFLYIRLKLVDSFIGIVVAHAALAIPFVVTTVAAGLKNFDPAQERAARNLGATRTRAVIDIVLPQLKLPILAGAIFAFVTSLDEVLIGLFIAGGRNTVLTRKMFLALRDQVDPTIAAISTLLIGLSIVAVGVFMVVSQREARSKPPA